MKNRTVEGNGERQIPSLRRILLIDDDPDIQLIARMALEIGGSFVVRTCGRGIDAPSVATEFEPQLILLDIMMPEMDGPATLCALRATPAAASVPVVFMTARPQDHASLQEPTPIGLVAKPFDPTTLAERLHEIWRIHHES